MFKRVLLVLLFSSAACTWAQTAAIQGFCDLGGAQAKTSGLNSTNYQQGIIPSCTVTVYLTGTTTKATIYADGSNTPLANPFTAAATGSAAPGQWIFWAAINQGYDVVMSGGISPNTYPQPVTLTDVFPSTQFVSPGGGCTTDCVVTDPTGSQTITQPDATLFTMQDPSLNGCWFDAEASYTSQWECKMQAGNGWGVNALWTEYTNTHEGFDWIVNPANSLGAWNQMDLQDWGWSVEANSILIEAAARNTSGQQGANLTITSVSNSNSQGAIIETGNLQPEGTFLGNGGCVGGNTSYTDWWDGEMVECLSASSGAFTVTLPPAAGPSLSTGILTVRRYVKIDGTSNAITLHAAAGDTINGASTYVLSLPYEAVELYADGTHAWYAQPTFSGTVTSVAATVPSWLSVAGSPVTNSGTLAITANNQSANTVLAGPPSGAAADPSFRALVPADVPALGYLPLAGGTLTGPLAGTTATFSTPGNGMSDNALGGATNRYGVNPAHYIDASLMTGADECAQIANAWQLATTLGWDGAFVDARNFVGTQTCNSAFAANFPYTPGGTATFSGHLQFGPLNIVNTNVQQYIPSGLSVDGGSYVTRQSSSCSYGFCIEAGPSFPATTFTITSAAAASGGTTVYAGTFSGSTPISEMDFSVSGFSGSTSCNGTYHYVSSTSTTLTLTNSACTGATATASASSVLALVSMGAAQNSYISGPPPHGSVVTNMYLAGNNVAAYCLLNEYAQENSYASHLSLDGCTVAPLAILTAGPQWGPINSGPYEDIIIVDTGAPASWTGVLVQVNEFHGLDGVNVGGSEGVAQHAACAVLNGGPYSYANSDLEGCVDAMLVNSTSYGWTNNTAGIALETISGVGFAGTRPMTNVVEISNNLAAASVATVNIMGGGAVANLVTNDFTNTSVTGTTSVFYANVGAGLHVFDLSGQTQNTGWGVPAVPMIAESGSWAIASTALNGQIYKYSGASAGTVTFPASITNAQSGWCQTVLDYGLGPLTVSFSGLVFNGNTASVVLPAYGGIGKSGSITVCAGAANAYYGWVNIPSYKGTTGSIGGAALAANACATGTATITGVTTSMSVAASPTTDPNASTTLNYTWYGYVSAANTVTVKECALVAGTPTATTFSVVVQP